MRVIYTEPALSDLDDILTFVAANYPAAVEPLKNRFKLIEGRLGRWPHSAPKVASRPGVRVVSIGKYPYKIFYRVGSDAVEILHIYHARRDPATLL